MKTTKTINDTPAEGHALLERHTSSFARTQNGAWIGNGGTTETFEIPLTVLNSPAGCGWLNPGRCGDVFIKLPDGSFISVSGANDPIRTNGFGELGLITYTHDGRTEQVCQPHPLLPNLAPGYYRVIYFTDDIAATFQAHKEYTIRFVDAEGNPAGREITYKGSRDFVDHLAKSHLNTQQLEGLNVRSFIIE